MASVRVNKLGSNAIAAFEAALIYAFDSRQHINWNSLSAVDLIKKLFKLLLRADMLLISFHLISFQFASKRNARGQRINRWRSRVIFSGNIN